MDNDIYGSSGKMPLLPIFQRRVIGLPFDPSRVTVTVNWTNSYWLLWPCKFFTLFFFQYMWNVLWVGIAQSVWRLATGGKVWGSNSVEGWDLPHPSRPALELTHPFEQWVPALFPGVKRPELFVNQPPPSSVDVKEGVELYLCSLSGPSWLVLGWPLCETY